MYYGNRKYLTSFVSLRGRERAMPRSQEGRQLMATLLNFKSNTAIQFKRYFNRCLGFLYKQSNPIQSTS